MDSRQAAERIFTIAVQSVNPEYLINKCVSLNGNILYVAGGKIPLDKTERIFVVGAGKATALMATGIEKILGSRIDSGQIVVKYGHTAPLNYIKVIEAGHPVPDSNGFRATAEIAELVAGAGINDLVICLISGGGSALLADCPEGITQKDLADMNDVLVRSGAGIDEINVVRKHVSSIKGGRLAAIAYPARLINLILSDVPGDSPEIIASGPSYPDSSTFNQAMEIIHNYKIQEKIPVSIVNHIVKGLKGDVAESPKPGDKIFEKVTNFLIGTNKTALEAASGECNRLGLNLSIVDSSICGNTQEAAGMIVEKAIQIRDDGSIRKPAALLYGGETTLKVCGTGLGGRNQHLALACAIKLRGEEGITVLAAGTDGTDGPTDAAGAVVDCNTLKRASELSIDPSKYLAEFDSYNFFRRVGGHIITGPTMTNVMDVIVVIVDNS